MTTSATVNSGNYIAIPSVVRDFYSKEVLYLSQPRLRFMQFAKIKRELQGTNKGKSMTFVKYGNLTGGGKLLESDILTPVAMSTSEVNIPVFEQGNAVEITEFLMRVSMMDVLGDASRQLAMNLAIVLDTQFRDVVLTTTNVIYGNQRTSAGALLAGDGLTTATVKDCVELLARNNAPKFSTDQGDYYVCVATPHQLRQLRDDPRWINANQYMGRRQLYLGECGMYEGVIFIETTQMPELSNAATAAKYGTFVPATGYEAVIFGENAYAWGVTLDVELREGGITELGRKRTIGWYGIWGMGLLESRNIVRVLTA